MAALVSVVIPTHNRQEFIAEAVRSVLDQTYKCIEIIVVDDGSTDNTREVISHFDQPITYIYQERSERSKARNAGVKYSSGEYIAFLDSDDVWEPHKIARQVAVLDARPYVGVVYTDMSYLDTHGRTIKGPVSEERSEGIGQSLYETLMCENVVGSPSAVMVRRGCLAEAGLFDERMRSCEDLDLWRRLAKHHSFYRISEPLVGFRIHAGNTQKDRSVMAEGYQTILLKICCERHPEHVSHAHEAVLKLLVKIADLYWHDRRPDKFIDFFLRAVHVEPSCFVWGFWKATMIYAARKVLGAGTTT